MFPSMFISGNRRAISIIYCLMLMSLLLVVLLQTVFLKFPVGLSFSRVMNNSMPEPTNNTIHKNKVICMILTTPSNWNTKGRAVLNTWAKRCYKAMFFYSKIPNCSSQSICNQTNAVALDIPDGRQHLTAKTLGALNYSFFSFGQDADFFLKADDDTYVIYENLQAVLSRRNSSSYFYFGRMVTTHLPKGYNSGGAGYLLSKSAAQLLLQNRYRYPSDCKNDGGYEDMEIGRCLAKFGIYPENDLDSTNRLIFHSNNPFDVIKGQDVANSYYINLEGVEFGKKEMMSRRGFMLSTRTASMHYVSPAEMYMFDFLIYHLKRNDDEIPERAQVGN